MDLSCKIRPEEEASSPFSDTKIRDRKPLSCMAAIKKHFKEYCAHTSIHGVQYFGEKRKCFEKFLWFIVFCITLVVCTFYIYLIYLKWSQSPVIVAFATRETPIYKIPFPAVTICPTTIISHECLRFSEVAKDKEDKKNISQEMSDLFDQFSLMCVESYNSEVLNSDYNIINIRDGNETVSEMLFDTFKKCNAFNTKKFEVKFMGESLTFDDVFSPIITDIGVCYTFNMMSPNDIYEDDVVQYSGFNYSHRKSHWDPQTGYTESAEIETYPRRASLAGVTNSLEIIASHDFRDVDYRCTGVEQGYKIVLHLPSRVPRPKTEYVIAPYIKASSITIYPQMMTTSERIKTYDPHQRNCYFYSEKFLKYFKTYSRTNCLFECLTNYTLAVCGCVEFYMPRNSSTPICGVGSLECVNKAQYEYKMSKLAYKLKNDEKASKTHTKKSKLNAEVVKNIVKEFGKEDEEGLSHCSCLLLCSDIDYEAGLVPMDWDSKQHLKDMNQQFTLESTTGLTQINIFFKKPEIVTTERNELYGPTDFLSNFGGLLGLFTGVSVLSIMEIIYFCSARIIGNIKLFGKWYGTAEDS